MWRDITYAARSLARSPIFTISAVVALGLAIGANATIFGLVDALWFRPPGVRDPGTLVRVFTTTDTDDGGAWSWPEYEDLRRQVNGLEAVAVRGRRGATLPGQDGTPELRLVNVVSTNFFTTLGVGALHGRVFTEQDAAQLERQPAVVLGHAFWRTRFGGDPSVVGQTVRLGRGGSLAVTVLGVLPERFRDLEAAADRDLWVPPQTWILLAGSDARRQEFEPRSARWFEMVARRRGGAGVGAVSAEVAAVAAGWARAYPDTNAGRGARVLSDARYRLELGGVNAIALVGLVLLVILITCVNVANLLLARAAARTQELSLRVALGAGRWRLVRQLMAESLLLGAAGALAGLTVAMWTIRLLPALLPPAPGFRSFLVFETDARLVVFTAAVTLLTTLLFGIAPSWLASRSRVAALIKGESDLTGARHGALRQALVVAQIAVSLVLLCGAGVLTRSFMETRRGDLGFARKPLLVLWGSFDAPRAAAVEGARQLEALPGVTGVAVAIRAPLSRSGGGRAQPVFLPHLPFDPAKGLPDVKFNAVSANFFQVFGTPLVRGRTFTPEEERGGERVVIVSEQFAAQFMGEPGPLDRTVRLGGPSGPEHRIVGVARDTVVGEIGEPVEPYFYVPFWRGDYGELTFVIESAADPAQLAGAARAALQRIDARLDLRSAVTMDQLIRYSAQSYQMTAALAFALGMLGLLLTTLGVYGAVAYRTTRRVREIGIRVALGAARHQVLGLVVREGARAGVAGVAIGLPLALLVTRALQSLLLGVAPWDPIVFAGAGAVLLSAVALASFVPAWRAARVNPAVTLKQPN